MARQLRGRPLRGRRWPRDDHDQPARPAERLPPPDHPRAGRGLRGGCRRRGGRGHSLRRRRRSRLLRGGDVRNPSATAAEKRSLHHLHDRLGLAIRNNGKPIIVKVRGYCIGGGNELNVLCDLTITGASGKFGQAGPKIGSAPLWWGCQLLPQVVGEKKAREILYLTRQYSAEEALAMGLVNAVVPDEELDAEVNRWCDPDPAPLPPGPAPGQARHEHGPPTPSTRASSTASSWSRSTTSTARSPRRGSPASRRSAPPTGASSARVRDRSPADDAFFSAPCARPCARRVEAALEGRAPQRRPGPGPSPTRAGPSTRPSGRRPPRCATAPGRGRHLLAQALPPTHEPVPGRLLRTTLSPPSPRQPAPPTPSARSSLLAVHPRTPAAQLHGSPLPPSATIPRPTTPGTAASYAPSATTPPTPASSQCARYVLKEPRLPPPPPAPGSRPARARPPELSSHTARLSC